MSLGEKIDMHENGMPPSDLGSSAEYKIERVLIKSVGKMIYDGLPLFKMGSNKLWVFVNGKKEYCGIDLDYVELTGTSIQFNKSIRSGSVIEVLVFN